MKKEKSEEEKLKEELLRGAKKAGILNRLEL